MMFELTFYIFIVNNGSLIHVFKEEVLKLCLYKNELLTISANAMQNVFVVLKLLFTELYI